MADPFSWTSLIGPAVGLAGSLGVNALQQHGANAMTQQQLDWEKQKYQAEAARRNGMQGIASPSMLSALGYQAGQIPNLQRQISGQSPLGGQAGMSTVSGSGGAVPTTPQSTASKALGVGGLGVGIGGALGAAGLGHAIGLGALGGPLGMGIGAAAGVGAMLANKIGQGRRTADQATGPGGFERNFTDVLKRVSAGQGTLADLQKARQEYEQNANAWIAQGGNHKKVAEQSLSYRPLQDTYLAVLKGAGG